ncbi:hypothetical protein [Streptomyces subrutilus]|uniref:hypothetical protein n=1 Tax=Streptomyces subrutilus TaxID=36818 RepID=UPI003F541792
MRPRDLPRPGRPQPGPRQGPRGVGPVEPVEEVPLAEGLRRTSDWIAAHLALFAPDRYQV